MQIMHLQGHCVPIFEFYERNSTTEWCSQTQHPSVHGGL